MFAEDVNEEDENDDDEKERTLKGFITKCKIPRTLKVPISSQHVSHA